VIASLIRENTPGYVAFRTRHGYKTQHEASRLRTFEGFLTERQIVTLSAISPTVVMEYGKELLQTRKPQTVNAHLGTLDLFFRYLERMDICERNPLSDREGFRTQNFCPYVFSDAEVDLILRSFATDATQRKHVRDFLSNLTRHCMLTIIAHCGLRISEACRLRLKDVDLEEKTIFIEQTKFRKDRKIPVSLFIVKEISNYIEARKLHLASRSSEYLFLGPKEHGRHYVRGSLTQQFHDKMQELRIWREPNLRGDTFFGSPSIHSLRHAFAMRTIRRWQAMGLPIDQIADTLSTYMGHADFSSTQVYLKALSHDPGGVILYPNGRHE
jgi:integrase/recombinase XerD